MGTAPIHAWKSFAARAILFAACFLKTRRAAELGGGGADSLFHGAVRADVHTVQELTDILVLREARLADQGRRAGGEIDVRTRQLDLVLGACALLHNDTWQHIDDTHALLTQVVAELDALPTLRDRRVDREVGIHQAHRVIELLLDAVEQIADVTAARLEGGQLLALGEVHSDADFLARVAEIELDGQVLEVARPC